MINQYYHEEYPQNLTYNDIVFKEIGLEDRSIIVRYLNQDNFMISDISFGNLFIWRLARRIRFAIISDCLVIETTYSGKTPFIFFPIGTGDKLSCLRLLKKYYNSLGFPLEFHSLEKHNLEILMNVFDEKNIESKMNRDRSDYIYLTQNLIDLAGRKYHKKKNHLNRFFEEYEGFSFEEIGDSNLVELQDTWNLWSRDSNDDGLVNESNGIKSVFENYNALHFRGGLLRFNNQIIAFSFGEVISDNLCIIHIEKANILYRGAYQAINQQLLQHCFNQIKYANREEDLGIEGLRKAKLSYNPDIILEKYEAIVK
ncbi:hypothetical protein CQA53_02945 [Helicobacter didelphidarum]|uniref:Phosphatidylglycerol lysyltransferase C-terminal domain-containing protein n=1 Tax=Helicobacter didelphidarum TaxID=2040648 RepID=A0A3D8INF2_9HELI|nr:phosphatidylglycerol lysyltransferase domain-containing protein [Helicobacter didelphidarum]RDU66742.1 hypothetical protein CQA53_02945 [Helicobacter didelphidarum]